MEFRNFFNESTYDFTSVYHVSPRSDMRKLRPTSHKKGTRAFIGKGRPGIFVAPKFKDAVAWATSYIGGKKYDTQQPTKRLKEKGRGRHGENFKGIYKNLTIYEIRVPKEVLKRSVYTGWWEPEYFIQEEDMSKMVIVSSKTYSFYDLAEMQSRRDKISFYPRSETSIKEIAKTNLAARFYLELKDLYNNFLLKGKSPIFVSKDSKHQNDHLINQEIEKLKNYIFKTSKSFHSVPILSLDKQKESEVGEIYKRIKFMIDNL